MTAANHAIAGTLIALSIRQAAVAVVLAFLSHFVLDALPHYGRRRKGFEVIFTYKLSYIVELLGIFGLILLVATGLLGFNIAAVCAVAAVSPDIAWIYRYLIKKLKGTPPPMSGLTKFHLRIQKYERPWGFILEITFFVVAFWYLYSAYLS